MTFTMTNTFPFSLIINFSLISRWNKTSISIETVPRPCSTYLYTCMYLFICVHLHLLTMEKRKLGSEKIEDGDGEMWCGQEWYGQGVESNLEHPRIDGIGSTKSKLGFGRALLYHSVWVFLFTFMTAFGTCRALVDGARNSWGALTEKS